jgi:Protein of unknown function (DUF2917)
MNCGKTVVGWIHHWRLLLLAGFLKQPRPPVMLTIGRSEVVIRSPVGRRPVILVLQGTAWITQAGDVVDYCMTAGEEVLLSRLGTVAVQTLGDQPCRILLSEL